MDYNCCILPRLHNLIKIAYCANADCLCKRAVRPCRLAALYQIPSQQGRCSLNHHWQETVISGLFNLYAMYSRNLVLPHPVGPFNIQEAYFLYAAVNISTSLL